MNTHYRDGNCRVCHSHSLTEPTRNFHPKAKFMENRSAGAYGRVHNFTAPYSLLLTGIDYYFFFHIFNVMKTIIHATFHQLRSH